MGMASGRYLLGPCDGMGVSASGHKGTPQGVLVVGGGGQGAEHMKLGKKKEIRTCTKTQFAHCIVYVQLMHGQAVCRGDLR